MKVRRADMKWLITTLEQASHVIIDGGMDDDDEGSAVLRRCATLRKLYLSESSEPEVE